MDCTMCGVIDCSGKQQCIFIPGKLLHFISIVRTSFCVSCASTKITPPPCYRGNDEFLSENYSATLEFVMLAVSSIHRSQISNAKHGCWTDKIRATGVFPALQLNTARFHQKCFAALKDGC